jgi:hypothetical protein
MLNERVRPLESTPLKDARRWQTGETRADAHERSAGG